MISRMSYLHRLGSAFTAAVAALPWPPHTAPQPAPSLLLARRTFARLTQQRGLQRLDGQGLGARDKAQAQV